MRFEAGLLSSCWGHAGLARHLARVLSGSHAPGTVLQTFIEFGLPGHCGRLDEIIIFWVGVCPVHGRMFSIIPGPHPRVPAVFSPGWDNHKCLQMSPGGRSRPAENRCFSASGLAVTWP